MFFFVFVLKFQPRTPCIKSPPPPLTIKLKHRVLNPPFPHQPLNLHIKFIFKTWDTLYVRQEWHLSPSIMQQSKMVSQVRQKVFSIETQPAQHIRKIQLEQGRRQTRAIRALPWLRSSVALAGKNQKKITFLQSRNYTGLIRKKLSYLSLIHI